MNPTSEQFAAIEKMYDYFNKKLFENKLPRCLLNFSRKDQRTFGFFAEKRWYIGNEFTHEISLNPLRLTEAELPEQIQTLVHEMCHLWQCEFGKKSRTGYHNTEWGEKMEAIGLMPSSTGRPGERKKGQHMDDYKINNGLFDKAYKNIPKEYLLPWSCVEGHIKSRFNEPVTPVMKPVETGNEELDIVVNNPETIGINKYNKNKVKYSCPDCGSNVWGKPELNIICGDCEVSFIGIE